MSFRYLDVLSMRTIIMCFAGHCTLCYRFEVLNGYRSFVMHDYVICITFLFSILFFTRYYVLAHAVNERVTRQPSMLRAGTLRDYQLVNCIFFFFFTHSIVDVICSVFHSPFHFLLVSHWCIVLLESTGRLAVDAFVV